MSTQSAGYVEHGQIVTGLAAFLIARLLPRAEASRRLEQAGFADPRYRAPVLAALEGIRRAGEAWHEAARREPEIADLGSSEVPTSENGRCEEAMRTTVTTSEAAQALGVGPTRVRQMLRHGQLPGQRRGWAWEIDAAGLAATVEQRSEAA